MEPSGKRPPQKKKKPPASAAARKLRFDAAHAGGPKRPYHISGKEPPGRR